MERNPQRPNLHSTAAIIVNGASAVEVAWAQDSFGARMKRGAQWSCAPPLRTAAGQWTVQLAGQPYSVLFTAKMRLVMLMVPV